jgi:hypothetical protein
MTATGFSWGSSGGRISGHRITWYVWSHDADGGNRTKLRHTAQMRGYWPGWDATCECGWASRTGGATKTSVQRDVWDHKFTVHCAVEED